MNPPLEIGVGALVGLVLGLTGAGGSVIAVPLLLEVLHRPLDESVGLSLGVVALGALVGTLGRIGSGSILFVPGLIYATAGAVATPVGQRLGLLLPDSTRIAAFSLLVATVAVRLWKQASADPESTRVVRATIQAGTSVEGPICPLSPSGKLEFRPRCVARLALAGAVTGLLSGLFGVGGGFVIVPSLLLLIGIDVHRAVATSLFVITIVATTGFAGYLARAGIVPFGLLRNVSLGVVGGMGLGTLVGRRIAGPRLTRLFVVAMVATTSLTVFDTIASR